MKNGNHHGLKAMIKYMLYLIIAVALLINIITIATFPSWFDEAFFANVSFNLLNGDGFNLDLIPGYAEHQILIYGPVYFYIQAGLIHLFGLQEVVFRLPNLLAGYGVIFLLVAILKQSGIRQGLILFFVLAVVVDISFNRNLVYGRMDLIALFFVVFALYLLMKVSLNANIRSFGGWLLVGLVSSAAYLTSPRALFLLPLVFVIAIHKLLIDYRKPSNTVTIYTIIITLSGFLVPIFFWINHVGGLNEYAAIFQGSENIRAHIAPSIFRSYYDNIAIVILILLVAVQYRLVLKKPLLLGLVTAFLSFSLFVKEAGPYAAMINPLILSAIFLILSEYDFRKVVQYMIILLLIIPGTILLLLRGTDLIINSDCRNSTEIVDVINQQVGEKYVIPFKYYFFAENHKREVITLQYSKIDPEIVIHGADVIISDAVNEAQLKQLNFKTIYQNTCKPYYLPLLPATFYRRTLFVEAIFVRDD